tara:strand:- start:153 stop:530 length:378 start_codon:yes stop_codon:yes gene_type:complete
MLDKPEQTAAEEEVSVVQEDTISAETIAAEPANVATKKSSKKKATVKRKAPTAKSKRRKPAAKPVAPAPPPLTLEELKEQGREAKQEVINAVVEPALIAVGSLSQTIRDTIGGTLAGILSRKRRG